MDQFIHPNLRRLRHNFRFRPHPGGFFVHKLRQLCAADGRLSHAQRTAVHCQYGADVPAAGKKDKF